MMNKIHEAIVPILSLDNDAGGVSVMAPLGRGAKGVVFLVKEETNGEFLALKVILRDVVEKKKSSEIGNEYKRVSFERQVLSHFNHPLLPKLRGLLATDKIIGYAIDFCPGRDLNRLRTQQSEGMFSVDFIRFYAAELVLALEYLHNQGIAYRDLKPENILIQENGHIMLVDFDLSTNISSKPNQKSTVTVPITRKHRPKRFSAFRGCCNAGISPEDSSPSVSQEPETTEKSNSFVGTEEYVPPEIIQGNGHDFAVDWWSLGIVLYEMLYGITPFKGSNRKETFFRVLTKPPNLVGETTPLRDLISKLLIKDPKTRIKVGEIKRHEFFKGIDWEKILEISRPPHIPAVSHEEKGGFDGSMKIDVESFVQKIFGGDSENENKNKKIDGETRKASSGDNDENGHGNQVENEDKKMGHDGGMWVQGLNNHPLETDNFLVF